MASPDKLRRLSPSALRTRLELGGLAAILVPLDPRGRLDRIELSAKNTDGLRYLAFALPEREAVWWACMCFRHVTGPERTAGDAAALLAAETWVRQPTEAGRTAMVAVSREADPAGPAAFAARAVYASRVGRVESTGAGPSVSQSVLRSAGLLPDAARNGGIARFRASALEIAAGGGGWIGEAAATARHGERRS